MAVPRIVFVIIFAQADPGGYDHYEAQDCHYCDPFSEWNRDLVIGGAALGRVIAALVMASAI